jgi:hypothetical protein
MGNGTIRGVFRRNDKTSHSITTLASRSDETSYSCCKRIFEEARRDVRLLKAYGCEKSTPFSLMTNLLITTIITSPNIYEFGFGKITARDIQ